MQATLKSFESQLASGDIAEADDSKYHLVRSLSFCKSWSAQMCAFLAGCQAEVCKLTTRHLQSRAEDLENSVPRWLSLFPRGQEIDWALASARVLAHPRRSMVTPLVKSIKCVLHRLDSHLKVWGCSAKIDIAISAFVADTLNTAEVYLLVVAAVNTLTTMKGRTLGNHAQEILDFGANRQGFDFPESLKSALQQATLGTTPSLSDALAGQRAADSRSSATASESSAKRIKKEPDAQAMPGPEGPAQGSIPGPSGSSSGAAPAPTLVTGSTKAPVATSLSRPKRAIRAMRRTTY